MTTTPIIRRPLLPFSLKPTWRAMLAWGAFAVLFGSANAESIPDSPENFQSSTDWVDHSPQPLTVGHLYRSFGDPDEDADIGMGKGWTHSWSARLKLPKYYDAR